MNKTWLVIQREYLTRVRKRTFIISTILFPLLYLALIFGTSYIAAESSKNLHIAVIDSSGYFDKAMIAESNRQDSSSHLEYISMNPDSVIHNYSKMGYDGYVVVPAERWEDGMKDLVLISNKTQGIAPVMQVQNKFNLVWAKIKSEKL